MKADFLRFYDMYLKSCYYDPDTDTISLTSWFTCLRFNKLTKNYREKTPHKKKTIHINSQENLQPLKVLMLSLGLLEIQESLLNCWCTSLYM